MSSQSQNTIVSESSNICVLIANSVSFSPTFSADSHFNDSFVSISSSSDFNLNSNIESISTTLTQLDYNKKTCCVLYN